jgi:hypothetical protein
LPVAEVLFYLLIAIKLGGKNLSGMLIAEPGIELGPALKQADDLPTELRRTLLRYVA